MRAFIRFWYRFLVGDDWVLLAGTVITLAVTFGVSRSRLPSWWVLPVGVILLLAFSVWRAQRSARQTS